MTTTETTKKNPVPVRFDGLEAGIIDSIHLRTGLSKAEIVRRACRFSLPKFQSGEVNLMDLPMEAKV